jgi:hypothetical protein
MGADDRLELFPSKPPLQNLPADRPAIEEKETSGDDQDQGGHQDCSPSYTELLGAQ